MPSATLPLNTVDLEDGAPAAPEIEAYSAEDLDAHLASAGPGAVRIRRNLAPKELLAKPRIGRMIRFALEDWALIGLCWLGIATLPIWTYPVFAIVIGSRFQSLGVILHDVCHMPRPRKMTARLTFLEFLFFPTLCTIDSFRYHHLRHHRDSGLATDPYYKQEVHKSRAAWWGIIARQLLMPIGWGGRAPMGVCALFIPALRNPYARIPHQDKSGRDLTNDPEVLRCCRAEIRQCLYQIPLLAVTFLAPVIAILYFWIPNLVAWLLSGYRILNEHIYKPAEDRSIETTLEITCDHHLAGAGRFFFGPRNIGYHIVHHIHPQVALENLPRLRDWYVETYPELYPRLVGAERQAEAGRHQGS